MRRGEEEVTGKELRGYLRERLPEYMVPTVIVMLEEMPLTTNGKVDKRALPAPEYDAGREGEEYIGARTATEEIVAGVYEQVLGVGRVSVTDNFFDLGGHSLLATQVISRVRELFEVEVQLRELFEAPTVSGMSEQVERAKRAEQQGGVIPALKRVSREGEIPLSFAQQRLWFIDQLEAGSTAYNLPLAVRLSGRLDVRALERTLSEIVRRHEVLRTSFAQVDGRAVQVIEAATEITLKEEDISAFGEQEAREEAQRRASEEARRPFDLSHGPLLRVRLLKLHDHEHVVLLTMHHIISDGWSMGVLIKEVGALYNAFMHGQDSPLPDLPVQYADFALWQRAWLQGAELDRQMSYWRQQLAGRLPLLDLPADHPRPALPSPRGATHSFLLSRDLTIGLRQLCRQEGVTLFMTLLAAWQVLLARYSGQQDIIVGTDIANRNRAEIEPLIGFFVNQLVLRSDLSGDPSFRELLRRVREVCWGAYAHQDVPFEKLVDEMEPTRELSRGPLYQVKLVLQNTPLESLEMEGVGLSLLEPETQGAKLDMTLTIGESGEGLSGRVEYNPEMYGEERMKRMCSHYEVLLGSIVARPHARLDDLEIFTEAENQERIAKKKGKKESNLKRLLSGRRKTIETQET